MNKLIIFTIIFFLNGFLINADEQIKPNFIPKAENENYIEEERSMEDLIKQSQNKKVEQDRLDVMYEELQTPLMVMILFFFFQLPPPDCVIPF